MGSLSFSFVCVYPHGYKKLVIYFYTQFFASENQELMHYEHISKYFNRKVATDASKIGLSLGFFKGCCQTKCSHPHHKWYSVHTGTYGSSLGFMGIKCVDTKSQDIGMHSRKSLYQEEHELGQRVGLPITLHCRATCLCIVL